MMTGAALKSALKTPDFVDIIPVDITPANTPADITIVHLAVDYNTPQRRRTTTAIEWFVSELTGFQNVVIAMRRTSRPDRAVLVQCDPPVKCEVVVECGAGVECEARGHRLFDCAYFGLPLGIGLHRAMRKAASTIIELLEQQDIRPDLVHAHKFSFEGLAGWYVARHFDVPLFISLRGEAESKVFTAKPLLRAFLRRVAQDATRLYFVSAWFEPKFNALCPGVTAKERRLPNIVRNIAPRIAITPPGNALVSVFNLDTHKRKGLSWLLEAMQIARRQEPGIRLDIIGGGTPQSVRRCQAMIDKRGLGSCVRLAGALSNSELLQRLPVYRGFALPSLNETFGMVYIESLFAGIPVLYTAGTAIDGYLDGLGVAIATPPRDSGAIALGLLDLWRNSAQYRENILSAAPELFATFDPAANIAHYRGDVGQAVSQRTSRSQ